MIEGVSDACAFFWTAFLLLVCLTQPQYDACILFYFILFCYYLWEACSFLKRDRKTMDPDGGGGREDKG